MTNATLSRGSFSSLKKPFVVHAIYFLLYSIESGMLVVKYFDGKAGVARQASGVYCRDNPVSFVDHSGRRFWGIFLEGNK
ncbi:MAG: hypothetical protein WAK17_07260 [Candidatus Nitrosopolaris sp.]|jgi:hypothetical protein